MKERELQHVSELVKHIECINRQEAGQPLRYYRGLSNDTYDLRPSVMRKKNHRKNEGEMLRDLMTRQPDEFAKFPSALDRWMLAQHHRLPTRFLDISANPLVGLYFACQESMKEVSSEKDPNKLEKGPPADGLLYVFTTTRDRVKPYDSDAVSIIANFARLRKNEQVAILKTTRKFLSQKPEPNAFHRCRRIMLPEPTDVIAEVRNYHDEHLESFRQRNEASGRYSYMGRLQTFIEQEKPYFVENLIKPRDLFRIFIVQPRRLFPRVRAQSGAFLVSAYHGRFDFECKEQNSCYRPNNSDVPYNYYRFRVKAGDKLSIRKELESLNISTETLFPGLDESAEAIKRSYE